MSCYCITRFASLVFASFVFLHFFSLKAQPALAFKLPIILFQPLFLKMHNFGFFFGKLVSTYNQSM